MWPAIIDKIVTMLLDAGGRQFRVIAVFIPPLEIYFFKESVDVYTGCYAENQDVLKF